ncbi:hypothetical protein LCGC14_2449290 [marine sediment metagenome]|uniref:Uncharacterized protein n=1 Tax=marine sediment metagenome TaxID=412755 RepID=A0A0F9BGM6_9ZZZZ
MKKLKLKPGGTAEEARRHSSLGLVYLCPNCKLGRYLKTVGSVSGTVKCTNCEERFKKP